MGNKSSSALPYNVGDRICSVGGDGWSMYEGERKRDAHPVSVFKFTKTGASPRALQLAENFVKRMKTIRHPHVLAYMDGLDTETEMVMVTDRVDTLENWLNKLHESENDEKARMAISWGLHSLLQAVGFINEDCKMAHGALSLQSVMVTKGGDWKLGGMFVLGEMNDATGPCQLFRDCSDIVPHKYQSPEQIERNWSMMTPTSVDVWGLGCILYEAFNGVQSSADGMKGSAGKIPPQLFKAFKLMMAPMPRDRPSAKRLMTHAGFKQLFQNQLFSTLSFLYEFQLKTDAERIPFVNDLKNHLNKIPKDTLCYTVLPILRDGIAVSPPGPPGVQTGPKRVSPMANVLLGPLIQIGTMFEDENVKDLKRMLIPTIVELYSSKDRSVRVILLERLKDYIQHIEKKELNTKVFPEMCSGFKDSAPLLRELTVKSMVVVAQLLDKKNLNEVLLRNLVTLLKDSEPAIRTNTLICLCKVMPDLTDETKKKVALGSFPQVMRDPFAPARIAALRGLATSIPFLEDDPSALAGKVIPSLGFALVDPDVKVRTQAFTVLDQVIAKLRNLSETQAIQQKKDEEEARRKDMEARRSGELNLNPNVGASSTLSFGGVGAGAGGVKSGLESSTSGYLTSAAGWAVDSLAKGWASTKSSEKDQATKNIPLSKLEHKKDVPALSPKPVSSTPAASGWNHDTEDLLGPNDTSDAWGESLDLGNDLLGSDDPFGDDGGDGWGTSTITPATNLKTNTSMKIGLPKKTPEQRKADAAKKLEEAKQRRSQRRNVAKPVIVAKKLETTGDDWEDW